MARQSLASLINDAVPNGLAAPAIEAAGLVPDPEPPAVAPHKPVAAEAPSAHTTAVRQPQTRAARGPRYLELDRKDVRMRGDQVDALCPYPPPEQGPWPQWGTDYGQHPHPGSD
jgi:hypothetical protein